MSRGAIAAGGTMLVVNAEIGGRPGLGVRVSREEILEYLAPRVAKWWLPDDVVFIDEVPKTSVGKFSKKDLRERFAGHQLP